MTPDPPPTKETVKQPKNKKLQATQRYIDFSGAREDTLILKNGGLRAVLEVGSVNFNLKSEEEQQGIIVSYQRFLNALDFPVQVLMRSRKLDIDGYMSTLKLRHKEIKNQLLHEQMIEYMDYVSRLVEYSDIMEKKFYAVVPINPPAADKVGILSTFFSFIKPDDTVANILKRRNEFGKLKKDLESRVNVVTTGLNNCSLRVRRLSTSELIQLMYQVYNPQAARTQKMDSVADFAVTDGPEEMLA